MAEGKQHNPRRAGTSVGLPARLKVLYVVSRPGASHGLADALSADCATKILLTETVGGAAGIARLHDEVFDAVLVYHQPGTLDALDLVEGLRTGGTEEPILILGEADEREMAALCYEVAADDYCRIHSTTARCLLWKLARAIERYEFARETRRLQQADRQRLEYEHREAERLLAQQRALVQDLESLRQEPAGYETVSAASCIASLPGMLIAHYREMLRAYVIMGSGNLAKEMAGLAQMLVAGGVTARQTMHLHLHALEDLIRGLGNRSARHVISRADLLLVEVLVHLCEGYRCRQPAVPGATQQRMLPGFVEASAQPVPA